MVSDESATTIESLPMVGDELEVAVWDTEEILPDPSAVDPANARLTVVAANLACARQSTSFDNLDGIATLEQQLLDAHGVSSEEYAAFNAEQAEDAELRSAVRDVFVANCSPA